MATITKNRRKHHRHRIAPDADVRIEFSYPNRSGRPVSLPVLDISPSGFSFAMLETLEDAESGVSIPDATLRLGNRELHGDLIIMHVTHERGVCGALFYPATDEDLIRMKFVLAGIEAVAAAG